MRTLIVIGGGAAGIFCAINAAKRDPDLQVTLLEKTGKLLSKVKVSGGGRCNVTHACFEISDMAKRYPRGEHFVRKAFHRFFTKDTIDWFAERDVQLKSEEDGRMFPVSNSSQTIIDCLMKEVNRNKVEIRMGAEVTALEKVSNGGFQVTLADSRTLYADIVCIACGGYPKSAMFDWISRLGHSIESPVPSLFTFNIPIHPITQLMGVAVPVAQVKIAGIKLSERGPLLITHWGLSGPVILRLSAWGARDLSAAEYKFDIIVNWLPEFSEQRARERLQELRYEFASQKMGAKNPLQLPQRLWEYILASVGIRPEIRWADLPAKEQNKLVEQLCAARFSVQGKTTFKEEFVTAGGVRLSEVDPNTMQSKLHPGLFFAGEILDVDGITGGYNFQHAWTSGWVAAEAIGKIDSSQELPHVR